MGYVGVRSKLDGRKNKGNPIYFPRFMIHQGHIQVNGNICNTELFAKVFKWEKEMWFVSKEVN